MDGTFQILLRSFIESGIVLAIMENAAGKVVLSAVLDVGGYIFY
jgi:hypothetical protein